jgi:hypothetical protein
VEVVETRVGTTTDMQERPAGPANAMRVETTGRTAIAAAER